MPVEACGVRIDWGEVPDHVRSAVEAVIGGKVESAVTQVGGFSPGTAVRVTTKGGTRAFVKAVSSAQNERTPSLHRAEAHVLRNLPPTPLIPPLIGIFDDGDWVAIVSEDIDGTTPVVPWNAGDIDAAMAALTSIEQTLTPNPVPDLPPVQAAHASVFSGWERIMAAPPPELDPVQRAHLDELASLAAFGLRSLDGSNLVHSDIRADNLIRRPGGTMTVIDWPWACVGAAWLDRLLLIANIDLYGSHDPEELTRRYLSRIDPEQVTAVVAGLCGYFVDIARKPPDPGLPTVRVFQQAQALSTWKWFQRRHWN